MRIAVHAKVLSEEKLNGIGVYTYNLLKAISKLDEENKYILYSNKPIIHKINADNFKEKILKFPKFWSYLRLPFEFIGDKYDLLFVPKEFTPPIIRPKTVVVCYDFGGLIYANHISFDAKAHLWIATHYSLKAANKIIAISESTKKDIIKNCNISPNKIITTPLGFDEELYKPCTDESLNAVKEKYGVKSKYIINTSSILWYRKNLPRLINAFHKAKTRTGCDHRLLITGKKGEAYNEIINLISKLKLEKDVVLTGYIPIDDMPVLLSGADALVFPSLYEGFGLPLVEAMACGCPVITSNTSSLPEVVGDAGILIDPHSEEDIAKAIEKVITDEQLREKMRRNGFERAKLFSWEKTARLTLKVFEDII